MIYHIFPGNCEHLVIQMLETFSQRIHRACDKVSYLVLFANNINKERYNKCKRVTFIDTGEEFKKFIRRIACDDIVILHSTLHGVVWKYLFYKPSVWSRFIWIAWGGDFFYQQFFTPRTLKERLRVFRMKLICRRMAAIGTLVPGDYDSIAGVLGCKGTYCPVSYSSHTLKNCNVPKEWYDVATSKRPLRVLVGNSAAETNRHTEAFDFLCHLRSKNMEIICPLGYPEESRGYAEYIAEKGKQCFGKNFRPLRTVVSRNEYKELLDTIDVVVVNHLRQQGLFNIVYSLSCGKKVFLRNETTTFAMLKDIKIQVYDTQTIAKLSFEEFATMHREFRIKNVELARMHLSQEKAIQMWEDLFRRYHYDKCDPAL